MVGLRRLERVVAVTAKAIIACRCQRAAPTATTLLEILALTALFVKGPQSDSGSDTGSASDTGGDSDQQQEAASLPRALVVLSLRLARSWSPAVVVAQGVRLVGSLVQKREHPHEPARQEGTEVRALQLGLSAVPRVDPRVPRSLQDYTLIYKEWLLLLRGRLAQSSIELPEGLFDAGQEGDEELIRFALGYNLLQARSLKDALVCQDRTISNVKEFSDWYRKYSFIAPADLEAWQRIAWWEGPDNDGYLWLMIDFRAAVEASRAHGPELVARVLVSNMEYGVRQLIPELGCAATLRVVVDTSGVHAAAVLRRSRGVLQRCAVIVDRMYPCRLHLLYLVALPFPLRWAFRACTQLLHQHTRRKIRMCRATEVPRRLPSQLRSHKLSLAAGLDTYGAAAAAAADGMGPAGGALCEVASAAAGSVIDSDLDYDIPFTPRTPILAGGSKRTQGLRHFRWRRGRAAGSKEAQAAGAGSGTVGSSSRQRLRVRLLRQGLLMLLALGVLLVLGYAAVLALQPGWVLVPAAAAAAAAELAAAGEPDRFTRQVLGRLAALLQKQTQLAS